jgi:hypothetical protein
VPSRIEQSRVGVYLGVSSAYVEERWRSHAVSRGMLGRPSPARPVVTPHIMGKNTAISHKSGRSVRPHAALPLLRAWLRRPPRITATPAHSARGRGWRAAGGGGGGPYRRRAPNPHMLGLRPAPTPAVDGLYGDGILHESHRPSGILNSSAESLYHCIAVSRGHWGGQGSHRLHAHGSGPNVRMLGGDRAAH